MTGVERGRSFGLGVACSERGPEKDRGPSTASMLAIMSLLWSALGTHFPPHIHPGPPKFSETSKPRSCARSTA